MQNGYGYNGYDGYVELHAKSFHSFGLAPLTPTSCWPRPWSTVSGTWP